MTFAALCLAATAVSGCGATDATADTTTPALPSNSPSISMAPELEPIVAPTLPEEIPGYTEVDPATGLHVTGIPSAVDLASYRLRVTGKVVRELSLTYDEIRSLPKVTASPTLTCPGAFVDHATWSGVPIPAILELAGVQPDAKRIRMEGADGYSSVLLIDEALQPQNFLAYELEGETLPALHGFPLRAVIPEHIGAFWVKWILEIQVQ
jgi:DMSO/TMAO reductase YedYZ molybdopterin-dependent catalytic subunit